MRDRARVLCVQRTGWGKSAVYFVATHLLRGAGAGPTLIVSPLLALMRNQIEAAERLGLRAYTINSSNREQWDEVRDLLARDAVDLLLISPERLNNPQFRDTMLPLFAAAVGLLVIDEAHCISDWGHDFRPDYRRVRDMLALLAPDVAVLGTTATANDRVVDDVVEQLSGTEPLRSYRGPLARTSLRLEVVELPQPAQRLAWLAEHLPTLPGAGIVYTLTKRDCEQVAGFLTDNGVPAVAYSGDQSTEERIETEERLLANQLKAVVATSALGMGYDKPDLTFVVHYQAPGSVISYYQQVGRAGRGVDHADIVLLRGQEDRRIQDFFIEQAFPSRERVSATLEALEQAAPQGLTARELMAAVNLGLGRIEAMLKILDVEGAVRRDGSRWRVIPGADWSYDSRRYEQITKLRRAEQQAMAAFGADGRCLMRTLQEQLDDPAAADCGRCSVCTAPRFAQPPDPGLVERAGRHLRSRPVAWSRRRWRRTPPGRCAGSPRTRGSRAAGRWPASATAAGGRRWSGGCATATSTPELVAALAEAVAAGTPGVADQRPLGAPVRHAGGPGRAGRRAAGRPAPRARAAHRAAPAAAGDGQRGAAGRQRPRGVPRDSTRRRPAPGCCWTTAATRAGRWPWSGASCAAPGPSGSWRWPWPPSAERAAGSPEPAARLI